MPRMAECVPLLFIPLYRQGVMLTPQDPLPVDTLILVSALVRAIWISDAGHAWMNPNNKNGALLLWEIILWWTEGAHILQHNLGIGWWGAAAAAAALSSSSASRPFVTVSQIRECTFLYEIIWYILPQRVTYCSPAVALLLLLENRAYHPWTDGQRCQLPLSVCDVGSIFHFLDVPEVHFW